MSYPIGTPVAVISVHDAGWVRHVHPDGDQHDVFLFLAKREGTFPEHFLIPLLPGRTERIKIIQGPYRVDIVVKLNGNFPVYKARATRISPDGGPSRTTRIV